MFLEKFTLLAKSLHCRRQWWHGQISPLCSPVSNWGTLPVANFNALGPMFQLFSFELFFWKSINRSKGSISMLNCRMTRCPHPPRLVELTKWENFPGYGFNLHAEKTRQGEIWEIINCMVWFGCICARDGIAQKTLSRHYHQVSYGHQVNHCHLTRSIHRQDWWWVPSRGSRATRRRPNCRGGANILVDLYFNNLVDRYLYSFWKLTISLERLVDQNTAEFNNLFFHCFVWIFEIQL